MSEDKKLISRREALKKIGGYTAGSVLGGMTLVNALNSKNNKVLASENTEHPWPYTKLDVEKVRKLGHEGYYLGNCGSGSFYGIISALEEKVGEPYDQIPFTPPANPLHFAGGGMVGTFGFTCGTLVGAAAAINLVTDSGEASEIISELIDWYKETEFPSDTANEYASNHEYLVDDYKSDEELVQTVADSAHCEDSVLTWMDASGEDHGSPKRAERCARLTGDVVAKAVELLNG
ncbi:MAG: C-GCAxxG-C-C family (seleno)protein [Halanaerobiaceae bacterium]